MREQKMKVDHLISPLVPNEDYEGAMILFDIVVNEGWYALVELLSHAERITMSLKPQKRREAKKIK